MPKLELEGWSILEVEMDEKKKTFTVKRRLERSQLSDPKLKPTFIFYTSQGAQIFVNEKGRFLLRWKTPKYLAGKKIINDFEKYVNSTPKLTPLPGKSPLGRLVKKAMKQLFSSGKITRD